MQQQQQQQQPQRQKSQRFGIRLRIYIICGCCTSIPIFEYICIFTICWKNIIDEDSILSSRCTLFIAVVVVVIVLPFVSLRQPKLLQFVCIHYNTDEHIIIFMFIPICCLLYLSFSLPRSPALVSLIFFLSVFLIKTFLLDGWLPIACTMLQQR